MPNPLETSFIPKQPLLKVEGTSKRSEPINVALIAALIVFFVTLSVAGGLMLWKNKVVKTVEAKGVELQDAEKNFNIDDINMYKHLQTSLETAKRLVDNHTIFSVAFDLIEEQTAKNIALTSLGFSQSPQGVSITLEGNAPSYGALYFQVASWKKMTPVVKSVDLSSFTLDEMSGIVGFSTKILIDESYLQSAQVIKAQEREQINTPPPVAAPDVTPPLEGAPANAPNI